MSLAWQYNFPAHRDAGEISTWEQMEKIVEEACEVEAACIDGESDERIREECLDVVHACETLLRSCPAEEVARSRDAVVEKNDARGYYGVE